MQENNLLENAIQPFIKLAQNNLELVKSLSNSSATASSPSLGTPVHNPFLQGAGSAAGLLQPTAFLQLMQGTVKNYTEFMVALSQNTVSAVNQTQATLVREGRTMADNVADATEARKRRAAQSA